MNKYFLLGIMIGIVFMLPIIVLKIENNKLSDENDKLRQEIVEYKWQLEQVPMIMESVKDEWCKDYK